MIRNVITLIFFICIVASVFGSMSYMGSKTKDFKKGLEQHLLRNNQ